MDKLKSMATTKNFGSGKANFDFIRRLINLTLIIVKHECSKINSTTISESKIVFGIG